MNTVIAKLGQLGIEVTENMLMEFVLKSLPPIFDHFKLTYSIQKHKWSLEKTSHHFVLKKNSNLMKLIMKAQISLLPPKLRKGNIIRINKDLLYQRTRRDKSKIKHQLVSIATNLVILRNIVLYIMFQEKRKVISYSCLY